MIRISTTSIQGLAAFVARTPEVAAEAAKLAVGDAAEWGRNLSKREMVSTVNLPADALAGPTNTGHVTRLPYQAGMGNSDQTQATYGSASSAATPAGVSGQ